MDIVVERSVHVVVDRVREAVTVGVAGEGDCNRNLCWILTGEGGKTSIGPRGSIMDRGVCGDFESVDSGVKEGSVLDGGGSESNCASSNLNAGQVRYWGMNIVSSSPLLCLGCDCALIHIFILTFILLRFGLCVRTVRVRIGDDKGDLPCRFLYK